MSSESSPIFSHEMFSLDTLDTWSLFNVLKQTKIAGYTGPPSEPIAAYRRALLWTMSHNQPNENERIGAIYLKAEQAYIALDSEVKIFEFVREQQFAIGDLVSETTSPASSSSEKNQTGINETSDSDDTVAAAAAAVAAAAGSEQDEVDLLDSNTIYPSSNESEQSGDASPIEFASSSDSGQQEHGSLDVESDVEIVSSNNSLVSNKSDINISSSKSPESHIESSDSDVPVIRKKAKLKAAAKTSTLVPKNTEQNTKAKAASTTRSSGKSTIPVSSTSKPPNGGSKPNGKTSTPASAVSRTAQQNGPSSGARTSTPVSSISNSARQNGKAKPSEKIPSAPTSTALKTSSRKSEKPKPSERNPTPLSTVSKTTRQDDNSKSTKPTQKTSTPVSATAKISKQNSTGSKVSKSRRTSTYDSSSSSSRDSAAREQSSSKTPNTPPRRIMKHPVPWTSPGHTYIAPVYKPSGRSDLIKGFITYEPFVNGVKRKREIVGEPIVKPIKPAVSVVAPTPYHLNESDGPERAVKKGRRIKVPEPEPEPLPIAKLKKPVRYKYEFAPRPVNRNGRNVPYNGSRT